MAFIQDTIAKALSNAYNSSKSKTKPTPIKTDPITKKPVEKIYNPTSNNVSVRDYFENKGYNVDYDSKTGNIRIYDPKTGSSSMLLKGSYSNSGGTAKITSDIAKQVENTITSNKYTYTPTQTSLNNKQTSSSNKSSTGGTSYSTGAGVTTNTKSTAVQTTNTPANIALRDYFEKQGYAVNYDANTGNIRVYNPTTGASSMIMKGAYSNTGGTATITPDIAQQVLNTLSSNKYTYTPSKTNLQTAGVTAQVSAPSTYGINYFGYGSPEAYATAIKNKILTGQPLDNPDAAAQFIQENPSMFSDLYNQLYGTVTTPEQQYQAINPQDIQDAYMQGYNDAQQIINQLQQEMQNADVNTAPLYSQALDQFLNTLNQYQTQIVQQMQQQMGGVDPATLAAIDSLKETVKQQRDNLMEEMSRRGLLQSGIWLEMEDRINKGELTAQQQLLANRLSDLQNQLNQALMNFSNIALSAQQTYGLQGIQAAQQEALNRQQQLQIALQTALDEAYRQQQLALQQFQTTAPYMYLTEAERQSLPLQWTQTIGEVAAGPGYQPVSVRNYVGNSGTVSYDSNTGEVIINGVRINPTAVGGYISNGTAYIPQNVIDAILGR